MSQMEVGNVKIGLNDALYGAFYKMLKGEPAAIEKINTDLFAVVYRGEYKSINSFKVEANSNIDIAESKYDTNSMSGYLLYRKTAGVWSVVGNDGGVTPITDISLQADTIDISKIIAFGENNVINFELTFKNAFYIPISDFVGNIAGIVLFSDIATPLPYIYLGLYPFEKKEGDSFTLRATLNLSDI